MTTDGITAFAPATVANVTCGFDLLGFAVEAPGDRVRAVRRKRPGVEIVSIEGDDGRLPRDVASNTAGVAVAQLLERRAAAGEEVLGVELSLEKGMPLASGLGSSAASGVAAVVAVNALFQRPSPRELLLRCAMEGERVACGTAHADNVAPSLFGGLVLSRGAEPRVDRLVTDPDYFVAVAHPHLEVRTAEARAVLPSSVPAADAVEQAGNLAALVAGLATGDDGMVASALTDRIAEPARAHLVAGFPEARDAAIRAGALGGGLSGSGPSQFAIVRGRGSAERIAEGMAETLREVTGSEVDLWVSPLAAPGARVVGDPA